MFDRSFYLEVNRDVREAGIDPIKHFLLYGWREGRDPSSDFPIGEYLARHPDLEERGINPLLHAIRSGRGQATALSDPYRSWLEQLAAAEDAVARASWLETLAAGNEPTISVIVAVDDTPLPPLRSMIDAVQGQSYARWELHIAADAAASAQVRQFIEAAAAAEPRVRLDFHTGDVDVAVASNAALARASGQYATMLDQDGLLHRDALACVAHLLRTRPGLRMVYTDEDVVDAQNRHGRPFFKPDFDHDQLLSLNCVGHLCVYETGLLREIGGCRAGFEESRLHDLALRAVERLQPAQIGHIPHVLYHRRAVTGSTAMHADTACRGQKATRRAIREHLSRRGVTGAQVVATCVRGGHRVIYPLPEPVPRVSVVIPTRDRVDLLGRCLETLFALTRYPDYEVVVVDNRSVEAETSAFLRAAAARWPLRVVPDDGPFNFARLNNCGVAAASGVVAILLNNDTEIVEAGWMRELASHACRPEVGVVGARLLYADGSIQHAGVALGVGGIASHYGAGQRPDIVDHAGRLGLICGVTAVTGACLAIRRDLYGFLGGMHEALPIAYNDIDLCLRVRDGGWRVVYTPHATLIHHESRSRGYDTGPDKARRLARDAAVIRARWPHAYRHDPFYNPNFSRRRADFSLGKPASPPYGTAPWVPALLFNRS
jgi:GT2 family glycosyltransferase